MSKRVLVHWSCSKSALEVEDSDILAVLSGSERRRRACAAHLHTLLAVPSHRCLHLAAGIGHAATALELDRFGGETINIPSQGKRDAYARAHSSVLRWAPNRVFYWN